MPLRIGGVHEEEEAMKCMRLAMCVAVFALIGGIAFSEDMDIRALQAKLAAQEARLNDLQAKMNYSKGGGEAEGVVSIRKNAVVTIGGTVNTRVFQHTGKVKSAMLNPDPAVSPATYRADGRQKVADLKATDLKISDAKLKFKIDVNEYFDAYLQLDLHDAHGRENTSGVAQKYYVRWKNVCNTGFGLIVGRNDIIWGPGNQAGTAPTGWMGAYDYESTTDTGWKRDLNPATTTSPYGPSYGEGMFVGNGGMTPTHMGWDYSRTTQINPYWESQNGAFKAEVSIFQSFDRIDGNRYTRNNYQGDTHRDRRSINSGLGNYSARLTWKPIEGLRIVGSVINFHQNVSYTDNDGVVYVPGMRGNRGAGGSMFMIGNVANGIRANKNNTATNLAFDWRPCFFPKLKIFSAWTHGWNDGWVDNLDSDVIQAGFSFDFTDQFTFVALGEYLRSKNKNATDWHKATGWAVATALQYRLPYGVNLEAGYRYEKIGYKNRAGYKHTTSDVNTVYGHLGFDF